MHVFRLLITSDHALNPVAYASITTVRTTCNSVLSPPQTRQAVRKSFSHPGVLQARVTRHATFIPFCILGQPHSPFDQNALVYNVDQYFN